MKILKNLTRREVSQVRKLANNENNRGWLNRGCSLIVDDNGFIWHAAGFGGFQPPYNRIYGVRYVGAEIRTI